METGTYSVTVWLQTLTTALKNRRHQTAHYGLSSLEARPTLTDWATNFIQTKYAHKVPLLTALGTALIHTYIPTCHLKHCHDGHTSTANAVQHRHRRR